MDRCAACESQRPLFVQPASEQVTISAPKKHPNTAEHPTNVSADKAARVLGSCTIWKCLDI